MGHAGWAILIVIIILAVVAYGGWVFWSRRKAAQQGLPPPSLNPFNRGSSSASGLPAPRKGGVVGWVNDQIRAFKNRRYASGAYEEGRTGGDAPRGAGHRLDPDEAWDTRVGNETYYEEQELGLHQPTAYGGSGYGAPAPPPVAAGMPSPYAYDSHHVDEERGRSRTRAPDTLDTPYDHETGRIRSKTPSSAHNPFGDTAEPSNMSLRGVSPKPLDTAHTHAKEDRKSTDNSPTERRSMFRENM